MRENLDLSRAKQKILEAENRVLAGNGLCRETVSDVVIVVSSPRSGSSMFSEILRSTPQLLTFQGAVTPFLAMEGLRYPYCTSSDALDERHVALSGDLDKHLAFECGWPNRLGFGETIRHNFSDQLYVRLLMQWPSVHIKLDDVRGSVEACFSDLVDNFGWQEDSFKSVDEFHAVFLREMCKLYPEINPYYYDIDRSLIEFHIPWASPEEMGPNENFMEMPPFILISPWSSVDKEMCENKPVVMKTVGNTFRLPFWKAFFPNARIRILHLTRSAPASVNGMYDGWMHQGFWCARSEIPLSIDGYSEKFPVWGRNWWKFGLFNGWEKFASKSVVEIATEHWLSCHKTVLKWKEEQHLDEKSYLKISFEELMDSYESRSLAFEKIASWLGVSLDEDLKKARDEGVRVQLATQKPEKQRWRKRKFLLEPVLNRKDVRDIMVALGYSDSVDKW